MKGSEIQLHRFMEGSEKRFIIPVYQRNYDWKIVNCRQLFDDLLKIKEDNRKSHFWDQLYQPYQKIRVWKNILINTAQVTKKSN